jgi:chaperone required for assembly of F1-ATPase
VTDGILPVAPPPAALEGLRRIVAARDDFELAALGGAVAASGSLVLALALLGGRIEAAEAADLSQLEEACQSARWGEDAEATARRRNQAEEIEAAAAFLGLLGLRGAWHESGAPPERPG